MSLNNVLVAIRLIVNLLAAVGCLTVAWQIWKWDSVGMTRYLMALLVGVAIYNAGAGLWFAVTAFGWVTPHPLLWRHMYTLLNMFESIPAVIFAAYMMGWVTIGHGESGE